MTTDRPKSFNVDVSIIIVNWNTCDLLSNCIESIARMDRSLVYQIIIVDNASSDNSVGMLRERFPEIKLIALNENLGFVMGNNTAYQHCDPSARYVLLLNPDTELSPDTISEMVRVMDSQADAGACGPLMFNTDGSLQASWSRFPTWIGEVTGRQDRRFHSSTTKPPLDAPSARALTSAQAVDWLGGACLLIRRTALTAAGFDTVFDIDFHMYSEETDLCYRLKRSGWGVYIVPSAEVVHHNGQSSKQAPVRTACLLYRSKVIFFSKHYSVLTLLALRMGLTAKCSARWLLAIMSRDSDLRDRQRSLMQSVWSNDNSHRIGRPAGTQNRWTL